MKLAKLLKHIDIFQKFQIINAMTGECITGITYLDDGGYSDDIALYENDSVHGVAAGITNDNQENIPYLIIMIDNTIR